MIKILIQINILLVKCGKLEEKKLHYSSKDYLEDRLQEKEFSI